jgi:hypothetical protein
VIASSAAQARPGRRLRLCRSRCGGTVQRTIFDLLDEPVPALANLFPRDDPLPGAYELHLPADDVTIWYTVTEHEGQEVISVQHVSLDT